MVAFELLEEGVTEGEYIGPTVMNFGAGIGISISAKDPVGVIEFLDKTVNEKYAKINSWGIEGEDYMVNEDGKILQN